MKYQKLYSWCVDSSIVKGCLVKMQLEKQRDTIIGGESMVNLHINPEGSHLEEINKLCKGVRAIDEAVRT